MMTKGKVKEEYLLTDDDMRLLSYVSGTNPRRSGKSYGSVLCFINNISKRKRMVDHEVVFIETN